MASLAIIGCIVADRYSFRRRAATYVILSRRKTGTFTKSRMMAKATAATRVPATTHAGKGVIAKPPTARVEAMRRSATDAMRSQILGRDDHR